MTFLLRFGKVVLVVAVIFFLSVSFALGGTRGRSAAGVPGIEIPADAVLVPVKMLKDFTLALLRVIRAGKSILLSASFETDSRGEAVSFL
jgi:hypothetical protein